MRLWRPLSNGPAIGREPPRSCRQIPEGVCRPAARTGLERLLAATPVQHDPQWRVARIAQEPVYQKTLPISGRGVVARIYGPNHHTGLGDKEREWWTDIDRLVIRGWFD